MGTGLGDPVHPRKGNSSISRQRKNFCGTVEFQWPAHLGQQENHVQDAQKVRPARPQRVKTGGVPSGVR